LPGFPFFLFRIHCLTAGEGDISNMQYKTVFYFRHEQLYTVHIKDSLQSLGVHWTGVHIILGRPVLKLHFILAPTAGVSCTVNFWFSLFIRLPVYERINSATRSMVYRYFNFSLA
jgi:hypothetical protein